MPQPRPGIWDARARNPQRIHYRVNCKEVLSAESENTGQILMFREGMSLTEVTLNSK